MKATDLRIGNAVNTPFGVGVVKGIVNQDVKDGVLTLVTCVDITYREGLLIDHISEIRLTPSILELYGFKKRREQYQLSLESSTCMVSDDGCTVYLDKPNVDNDTFPDFTMDISALYLHQLQNLHFSLTGKELVQEIAQ